MEDWLCIFKKSLDCTKRNIVQHKAFSDKWEKGHWRAEVAIDVAALHVDITPARIDRLIRDLDLATLQNRNLCVYSTRAS